MKKQVIAWVLIACVASGAGLLRLHEGQIQEEQPDGTWKCANNENIQ